MLQFLELAGRKAVIAGRLSDGALEALKKFFTLDIGFQHLDNIRDEMGSAKSYTDLQDLNKKYNWGVTHLATLEGLLYEQLLIMGIIIPNYHRIDLIAFKYVLGMLLPSCKDDYANIDNTDGSYNQLEGNKPNIINQLEDYEPYTDELPNMYEQLLNMSKVWLNKNGLKLTMFSKDAHQLKWYVMLLWLALKHYKEFNELSSKNEQLVITFNVFNGTNWCALNHSFQYNSDSTYKDWVDHWIKNLHQLIDTGYEINFIFGLELRIYSRKAIKITPKLNNKKIKECIGSLDIETAPDPNGELIPVAIAFKLINLKDNAVTKRMYYLQDFRNLHNSTYRRASDAMIKKALNTLFSLAKGYTIFIHNFGGFDGSLLIQPFVSLFGSFNIIMDKGKNFRYGSVRQKY
jgi:hypothetical protein